MKSFVLEDDKWRTETFKDKFKLFSSFTFARSIWEAKELFKYEENYDLLFLDHDLSVGNDKFENSGSAFCEWLVKNNYIIPKVIIHSHNPYGSENMKNILKDFPSIQLINFKTLLEEWDRGTLFLFNNYKYS